jgi:hypothetical protein
MTIPSTLADACPSCHPGDYPAILPHLPVTPEPNGSLRAEYRHAECGAEWVTWWDARAAGWWPLAPVPLRKAS